MHGPNREFARRDDWVASERVSSMTDDRLEWLDPDPSAEDEEDLQRATQLTSRGTTLAATDWTAETILGQMRRGAIDLDPRFQRRDAWRTGNRKSLFIESIILGLPVPQIVLAERKDRRNAYVVIDGKQRLLAMRQFAAEPDDTFDVLTLAGLEVRPDLNGWTLEKLRAAPDRADDLVAFENQTIRTVVVRNWPNEDFLVLGVLTLKPGQRSASRPRNFAKPCTLDRLSILRTISPAKAMKFTVHWA